MNFMFAMISNFVNEDQTLIIPTSILTIPFFHILLQYHLPRIKSINQRLRLFIFYSAFSLALLIFFVIIINSLSQMAIVTELRISFVFVFIITGGGNLAIVIYLDVKVYPEIDPNSNVKEKEYQNKQCCNLFTIFRYPVFRYSTIFFSLILYVSVELIFKREHYKEYLSIGWYAFISSMIVLVIGGIIIPFGILKINSGIVNVFAHIFIGISLMYSYIWDTIPYFLLILVSSFGYFTGYYTLCFDLMSLFHIENLFIVFTLFYLGMHIYAGSVMIIFGCIQWMSHSIEWFIGTEVCTAFTALSCFVGLIVNLVRVIKRRKDKIQELKEKKGNDLMD